MEKFIIRKTLNSVDLEESESNSESKAKRIKLEEAENIQSEEKLSKDVKQRELTQPQECPFGKKCYRRNIHHFKEYNHDHLETLLEIMDASEDPYEIPSDFQLGCDRQVLKDQVSTLRVLRKTPCPGGGTVSSVVKMPAQAGSTNTNGNTDASQATPLSKWEASAPYYLFLTSIGPEKSHFSLSFTDLFHPSFGEIKSICHINFMVEMDWLMDRITMSCLWGRPMTIVHGTDNPDVTRAAQEFDWIQAYRMKTPHPFGHHHTKMSLLEYSDLSVRILVYTANLIEGDWLNKTQGIWISPKCSRIVKKEELSQGESVTSFRSDIVSYLLTYHLKAFDEWIDKIQQSDMSSVRVVFVASAPNLNQGLSNNGFRWGVKKVETVLRKHLTAPVNSKWPLIAQCSSIGSLGPDISWVQHEWASFFDGPMKSKPSVKLVYPTVEDVQRSADGIDGADCLPYSHSVHSKQIWLEQIMHKWISFRYNRTYAMPHVKSYCRVSPDCKQMAWFILTSANLSKAAWGKLNKRKDQLLVMSWEAGVMFLPKFFGGGQVFKGEQGPIENGSRASSKIAMERGTIGYPFPVPYDLPPQPYTSESKPWLCDYLGRPRR